ncbi:MAG TPA: M48 family metallopeptidase, partial [Chthoniobacteraceae bacterium]
GRVRPHFKILPLLLAGLYIFYQFHSAEKFTNPVTGETHRVGMNERQEAALGLQSYHQILSEEQPIQSGPEVDRVRTVAQRLENAVGSDGKGFQWEVSVLNSPQMNAFCLPGGKICVYMGILPIAKNDAGLAAVLGHEMSHAIARHGSQRILQQEMTQVALVGIQGSMSEMDTQKRMTLMALLGAGAQYGVILPFSRENESEADYMGTTYMARAGYDPHEAVALWKRMSASGGGGHVAQYASTHPSNATRIQQLEDSMPKFMEEYNRAQKP